LIGYAVIYTVFLKRATPQNIVIGGAAGAAPPMLGWAAVNGAVTGDALLLLLIIFTWTPPHFWALAIARRADYERAEIPMLPVTHGEEVTKSFVVYYTILLLVVTVLPYLTRMSGLLYLLGALLLGAGFLYYAIELKRRPGAERAMPTFGYSITYLIALFSFLLVDHYIPAFWPA
jgi:heme o synthase